MIGAGLWLAAGLALQPATPPVIPSGSEALPFLPVNIVDRPSAASRHFLLAAAPRIPARGLAFTIRCRLDRSNGRVTFCSAPSAPAAYRAAATGLASLYRFRLTLDQMTTPGPLAVTIQDRIVPADVRPAARRFTVTSEPPAAVTFAQGIPMDMGLIYYPRDALAANVEARIRIDCQVQADLSLFCLNPRGEPGPFLAEFQLVALQLSSTIRVAPALRNGAPAAGTVFGFVMPFHIPAE